MTKEIETKEHKGIATAMLAVYKETGYVFKSGKIDMGSNKSYSYAGEVDLIKALRPVMIENGIIMTVSAIKDVDVQVVTTKKWNYKANQALDSTTTLVTANYEFTFTHVTTGENMKVSAVGQGADAMDKAAYKAATGALKYALRQSFIIETGDDPDKQSSEEVVESGYSQQAMDLWDVEKQGAPAEHYNKCLESYNSAKDLKTLDTYRRYGNKWAIVLVLEKIMSQAQVDDLEELYKQRKEALKVSSEQNTEVK